MIHFLVKSYFLFFFFFWNLSFTLYKLVWKFGVHFLFSIFIKFLVICSVHIYSLIINIINWIFLAILENHASIIFCHFEIHSTIYGSEKSLIFISLALEYETSFFGLDQFIKRVDCGDNYLCYFYLRLDHCLVKIRM